MIVTLPRGAMYRAAQKPYGEFSDQDEWSARIIDHIERVIALYAHGTTEHSQRFIRPSDLEAQDKARQKAAEVRKKLETTKWEDVE